MKTSSEKSTASHATPAQQQTNQPFLRKADSGGFVEPASRVATPPVQAKLTVSQPGDAQEQEADRMADTVVQRLASPAPPVVQRSEMPKEEMQRTEEEGIQKSELPEEQVRRTEEEKVQKAEMPEEQIQRTETTPASTPEPGPGFSSNLQASKGGGSPLPADARSAMESGFGADFSGVRVHTGPEAAAMSNDIQAQAFTHGNDIYFNEGKYNPGSQDGRHLLAHELTHTLQQGGVQRKAKPQTPEAPKTMPAGAPAHALDIAQRFSPDAAWKAYLDANPAGAPVMAKIGGLYNGIILVNQKRKPTEAGPGEYELDQRQGKQTLSIQGMTFLKPLEEMGFEPVLVLNEFGDSQKTTGFLSVKAGGVAAGNPKALLEAFNDSMDKMGFLGLDKFKLDGIKLENTFDNGRLLFNVAGIQTAVGGYLKAGVGMGISGENFTFDVVATVDVPGVATGDVDIKRTSEGNLEGHGAIEAEVANVQATLMVEFLAGQLTIKGTGTISSEKFSGSLTLLVTEEDKANEAVNTELGVQTVEQEAQSGDKKSAAKAASQKRVLVGWGTVQATITPWLAGTAKVGINSKGHITIVGEIVMPNEVVLMEKMGKKITLLSFEIRAGYGVPLVGQVFIFGGIELFMNAGFGPLVLRNVRFEGQYSTDPDIPQHFMITGTLGINAFAILGLEASAGVGLTLIGHDIKAGLAVTAAAGIKAYAEATPTLEYIEKGSGKGGKVGEAWLKGHFEAAAQLFLMLGGKFFVELDSPWWSPAPDETWDYPLGSVEYPIGDSMGIGADMEWLIGSPEVPELKFSPVEFNPEKFTEDVMADPPPGKGNGGEKDQKGEWSDQTGGGNLEENPQTNKDVKDSKNKKEDLSKLTAEQRYMRGLDDIGKMADEAKSKPVTGAMLEAKIQKVKSKYGLEQVKIKDKKDAGANVFVKHAGQDNSKHLLEFPLMSNEQRMALLEKASADFKKQLDNEAGVEGTITRAGAEALGDKIAKKHYVIEAIEVIDGGSSWDFELDLSDTKKVWKGKGKQEKEKMPDSDIENTDSNNGLSYLINIQIPFTTEEGEAHQLYFIQKSDQIDLIMASNNPENLGKLIEKELNEDTTDSEEQEKNLKKIKSILQEIYDLLQTEIDNQKNKISSDKNNATSNRPKLILKKLNQIKDLLIKSGIGHSDELPATNVISETVDGKAYKVEANPLTKIEGNTKGSQPFKEPKGWNDFDDFGERGSYWVRAHLLNEKLHGPGEEWNLVPATKQINSAMLHEMEKKLKHHVLIEKKIMYYKADVNYHFQPDAKNFPASINVQWGELLKLGGHYKKFPGGTRTFTQAPPQKALDTIPSLNQSSASKLKKAAKNGGKPADKVLDIIVNLRREQPSGRFGNLIQLVNTVAETNPELNFKPILKDLINSKIITFDFQNPMRFF